jgi:DNA topoisomerase IB
MDHLSDPSAGTRPAVAPPETALDAVLATRGDVLAEPFDPATRVLDDRTARLVAARANFRDRQTAGLTGLLERRPELRGLHALADFLDDSVRWSA